MNRVYVLKYKVHINVYSLDLPKIEDRIKYFSRDQRNDFITEYERLKSKPYIQDIKTLYAELEEVNMENIINAI